MTAKRTTRRVILSETKQIALHSGNRKNSQMKCEICAEDSPMISPENIAEILPIKIREIYRQIESNKIHFAEINRKEVLVCVRSLAQIIGNESKQIEEI